MNQELSNKVSFISGMVIFIIALSTPLILLTLTSEMNTPTLMNFDLYWTLFMSFSMMLILGYFFKPSENQTNLGCFIGIFVYASFHTQNLSEIIHIYGINSFIPLIFALFGLKIGITARIKFKEQ
ncbi:hypothetical protein [Colwellia psychrerythraea]|uniref:Uncharacterized protein n=1 Tax=Colwellia psychrerythraea TaxID=28229 RepID=A0A099KVI2_COLPS|nr:hypothetical protein [Colwellia psychrerythraea]KGJ93877.1 hypothetical protein GAB14E_2432 [Colwellia psychrerythraea]